MNITVNVFELKEAVSQAIASKQRGFKPHDNSPAALKLNRAVRLLERNDLKGALGLFCEASFLEKNHR